MAEFDRVEAAMNEWRLDSPLSAINAAAGTGRWVSSPANLCLLLERSLDAAKRTVGSFTLSCTGTLDNKEFTLEAAGSGATQDFKFTVDQSNTRKTTGVRTGSGWNTCATMWMSKKGQARFQDLLFPTKERPQSPFARWALKTLVTAAKRSDRWLASRAPAT